MDSLFQSGALTLLQHTQYTAYLLAQDTLFSPTEFKMLKHLNANGFLPCEQVRYNGKIKLVYLSANYTPLSNYVYALDEDVFLTLVRNLLQVMIDMKSNGFLTYKNLDLALNHIFVESTTRAVKLIYLPITTEMSYSVQLEYKLRASLIDLVNQTPGLHTGYMRTICESLANGSLPLEALYQKCADERSPTVVTRAWNPVDPQVVQHSSQPILTCTLLNAPTTPLELQVRKSQFILGKNPAQVDGAIPFNEAISRMHCKFVYHNDTYYVADLNSTNKTYLNGTRLPPNQEFAVANQDILRLANIEFILEL